MDNNENGEVTANDKASAIDTGLTFDTCPGRKEDENVGVGAVDVFTKVGGTWFKGKARIAYPKFHKEERDALGKLRSVLAWYKEPEAIHTALMKAIVVDGSSIPRAMLARSINGKVKTDKPAKQFRNKYLELLASKA